MLYKSVIIVYTIKINIFKRIHQTDEKLLNEGKRKLLLIVNLMEILSHVGLSTLYVSTWNKIMCKRLK